MRNLTAEPSGENMTDVGVYWNEPLKLNGDLDGYVVDVVDTTGDNVRHTFWLNRTETSFMFNSSEEYER